jgi:hypothetical protein
VWLHSHAVLNLQGAINLFPQFVKYRARRVGDVDVFQDSRPGQIDWELALNPTRAKSQKNYAIAESNCLTHVMCDENDGAPGLSPYPLQFFVQQISSLGVECGEGFVHQQYIWFRGESPG